LKSSSFTTLNNSVSVSLHQKYNFIFYYKAAFQHVHNLTCESRLTSTDWNRRN